MLNYQRVSHSENPMMIPFHFETWPEIHHPCRSLSRSCPYLMPRLQSLRLFDRSPLKYVTWVSSYPLVNKHSYWTWPFIVDFSIKTCDFQCVIIVFILVGGLEHGFLWLSIYWEFIIPTDELIFFRGIETTHQYIIVTHVGDNNKPPIWRWFIPRIKMLIWGMVFYGFTHRTYTNVNAITPDEHWQVNEVYPSAGVDIVRGQNRSGFAMSSSFVSTSNSELFLVDGLEHGFCFSICWEFHHPN